MGIAIVMHLGAYAVIVTDTRVTRYDASGTASFSDQCEKISRTSVGLLAGVGFPTLLESVLHRVRQASPPAARCANDSLGPERFGAIVRERREAVLPFHRKDSRAVRAIERETGWVFTDVETPDPGEAAAESQRVRVVLAHASSGCAIEALAPGAAVMFLPVGVSEADREELNDFLSKNLSPYTGRALFAEGLTANVLLARAVVVAASGLDETIGRNIQVGVHSCHPELATQVGHSGIILSDDPVDMGLTPTHHARE